MSELKFTNQQAYAAMFQFINKMHFELGWEELAPLLSGMSLIDGVPLDIAILEDWKEVTQAIKPASSENLPNTLTEEQAYIAMLHFLNHIFSDVKRDDLAPLIEDMKIVDGVSIDPTLMEPWERAIKFVNDGGVPDPYTVTKDGIVYELHRDNDLKKS